MTSSSELKDLYTPPEKMFVSHRIAARYNLDAIIENLKSSLENENCANFNSFIFGSVSVSRREMVKSKIEYRLDIWTFRDSELGEKCENKCEIEQFDCISKCETSNTACLSDCSRENITCSNCKLIMAQVLLWSYWSYFNVPKYILKLVRATKAVLTAVKIVIIDYASHYLLWALGTNLGRLRSSLLRNYLVACELG